MTIATCNNMVWSSFMVCFIYDLQYGMHMIYDMDGMYDRDCGLQCGMRF